jgi:hypothetical protein
MSQCCHTFDEGKMKTKKSFKKKPSYADSVKDFNLTRNKHIEEYNGMHFFPVTNLELVHGVNYSNLTYPEISLNKKWDICDYLENNTLSKIVTFTKRGFNPTKNITYELPIVGFEKFIPHKMSKMKNVSAIEDDNAMEDGIGYVSKLKWRGVKYDADERIIYSKNVDESLSIYTKYDYYNYDKYGLTKLSHKIKPWGVINNEGTIELDSKNASSCIIVDFGKDTKILKIGTIGPNLPVRRFPDSRFESDIPKKHGKFVNVLANHLRIQYKYITSYNLFVKIDKGSKWIPLGTFVGNHSFRVETVCDLNIPFDVRYIKLVPKKYYGDKSFKVSFYGLKVHHGFQDNSQQVNISSMLTYIDDNPKTVKYTIAYPNKTDYVIAGSGKHTKKGCSCCSPHVITRENSKYIRSFDKISKISRKVTDYLQALDDIV